MLPRARRLTRSSEITAVAKSSRTGAKRLVVHAAPSPSPSRFALAVSRGVGGAVQRNTVSRRLRHVIASELSSWDDMGMDVLVRALPPAAFASSEELASDLRKCRERLMGQQ